MPKLFYLFLSISVFCFVAAGIFTYQVVSPATASPVVINETGLVHAASLKIPALDLDLPVSEGEVKDNRWPTSTKSLIHVSTTKLPGTPGNSIIYGHNWKSQLGDLDKVKVGDTISVTLTDGSVKDFSVSQIVEVSPDQSDLLQDTIDTRLTLYTCSGFLDSKRLVVVAIPATN
ncbi:MAG: sortase [Patescibacteria group bacterium]